MSTQKSLYSLLNEDTKSWWYHRQLRDQGNHKEARRRERLSILSSVETLRNAYFFSVGHGGFTIYGREVVSPRGTRSSSKIQGYGGIEAPIIQAAIRLGVPGYDCRTVPSHQLVRATMRAPLVSDTRDEPNEDGTYGSLSYAPPRVLIEWWTAAGATIYNPANA